MSKTWWVIIIVVVLLGLGWFGGIFIYSNYFRSGINDGPIPGIENFKKQVSKDKWKEGGVAIAGKYADADLVDLGNGPSTSSGQAKWRLYYSVEPEVAGNKLELYSLTSTDGITWTKEDGARKEFATFPSVLKLSDGRFRLYFQNAGVIKSAISDDGLTWTDEPGTRIEAGEEGLSDVENVGAESVIELSDGTYLMVYRVAIKEKYSQEVPNNTTQILYYATSNDGLSWEKKGLALDSRNETLQGLTDGAELVKWNDNKIRLYFWSYKGIYYTIWDPKNGKFSQEPILDFSTSKSTPSKPFPPNPPGDPTLGKINGKWFMFYGQHEKGIYYATLN